MIWIFNKLELEILVLPKPKLKIFNTISSLNSKKQKIFQLNTCSSYADNFSKVDDCSQRFSSDDLVSTFSMGMPFTESD